MTLAPPLSVDLVLGSRRRKSACSAAVDLEGKGRISKGNRVVRRCRSSREGKESENLALVGASMANLYEKIHQVVASIPRASIDETLGLLGASSMAVIPPASVPVIPADPSTPEYSKQAIEKKLIDLGVQMFVLMHHEQNIKDASAKLEGESRRLRDALSRYTRPDFPPPVLIRFVDMLEEANQYFDLKLLAKKTHGSERFSSPDVISATLLKDQLLLSDFPKIGKPQLTQAAHAIFWELDNEKHGNEHARPKRDRALINLVYKLAFLTRELGYAMNEDPFVELGKIMEFEPYFYNKYFVDQQLPMEYTERSIQEAHSKYSQLVSSMVAKYEEALREKAEVRTTATGAINNEASGEKHELTTIATSARNKEAFHEKPGQEVTSNVTGVGNKEALREKAEVRTTATGAINNEASGEKHELTSIATSARKKGALHEKPEQEVTSNVTGVRNKEAFSENGWAITANVTGTKTKRSFETTDAMKKYPKKLKTNKASKNGGARVSPRGLSIEY